MKTLEMTKATASLAKFAREVRQDPVILTDKGKPVAALVSIENADRETVALSGHPEFLALIERSRARHISEGGISSKEMRRRLASKRTTQNAKRLRRALRQLEAGKGKAHKLIR